MHGGRLLLRELPQAAEKILRDPIAASTDDGRCRVSAECGAHHDGRLDELNAPVREGEIGKGRQAFSERQDELSRIPQKRRRVVVTHQSSSPLEPPLEDKRLSAGSRQIGCTGESVRTTADDDHIEHRFIHGVGGPAVQ